MKTDMEKLELFIWIFGMMFAALGALCMKWPHLIAGINTMKPEESAAIITAHPHHGVGLGMAAKLPKAILDIIREHHGTGLVKFFYFKALKAYGAETVKEADYRYKGVIPSSRESAIVMLADTV